ncbi:hypothetical protein [Marinagarivorans cellulosilyticus]|uniref:Uncharacterized protein n=1 Tax=Marinagarivorans cellulosilyticus TaxID=2721545 RepID=A0AAN1WDY6_9GAMM|nr:hypothetical protein [Marinagarivorans cellulosilyticus]BCD95831.1 hypothetical protein MARGE09_P0030 [Marinagarivorans cellulosilyticus]
MKQIATHLYTLPQCLHGTVATLLLAAPLGLFPISATVHAKDTLKTPTEFALDALQEACAPYASSAQQSLEAADLALYCLSTGETIALQAAKTPQQQQQVKQTVAQWIEELQPSLALYEKH